MKPKRKARKSMNDKNETQPMDKSGPNDREPTITDDAASLAKIKAAREEVRSRETEYFETHERNKEAKKAWEASVAHLTAVIDEVNRPLPLLDGLPKPAEYQDLVRRFNLPLRQSDDEPSPAEPSWEKLGVDELGLSSAKCAKLIKSGIRTLGQLLMLVDAHNGWGGMWFTDIPHFGSAAASDIAARWENFQSKHPEWFPEE